MNDLSGVRVVDSPGDLARGDTSHRVVLHGRSGFILQRHLMVPVTSTKKDMCHASSFIIILHVFK
jgi:hypothetical protein